jgi:transposase
VSQMQRQPLKPTTRTVAVRLKKNELRQLRALASRGRCSARMLKRARVLELLHEGYAIADVQRAVGTWPSTIRRVRRRYLENGLTGALNEKPRPGKKRLLTDRAASRIVAMVCSNPPRGCSRWSVRLIATEAIRRGIVKQVGRETIRVLLLEHRLKPWRKKNVVRANPRRRIHSPNGRTAGYL